VLVSVLLGYILKEVFQRPRPLLAHLTTAEGYSFPSGHSTGAFTLCGILLYLLWKTKYKTPVKIALSLVLLLFAALVALSRVYLHVHYASDVIGGFCITVVWLGLFFIGTELVNTGNKPGDKI
jgi:undecaprenyl-diphosphatase